MANAIFLETNTVWPCVQSENGGLLLYMKAGKNGNFRKQLIWAPEKFEVSPGTKTHPQMCVFDEKAWIVENDSKLSRGRGYFGAFFSYMKKVDFEIAEV